jgi:hypothetical protein
MYKLIRDGKVSILRTSIYGAGWSSWNLDYPEILFDPIVVDAVEREIELEAIEAYLVDKYPNGYFDGYDSLVVERIPVGTEFLIKEYDGVESVEFKTSINWLVA